PHMVIAAPSDENECRQLLYTCFMHKGPAAVRYPRGTGIGATIQTDMQKLEIGKALVRRETCEREPRQIAILCFGTLLHAAVEAEEKLDATLVDMRFVKPLDEKLIGELTLHHDLIITLEENTVAGGAGSAVNEFLQRENLLIPVLNLGLPDHFQSHGSHVQMLTEIGLDNKGILANIKARLEKLPKQNTRVSNQ